MEHAYLKGESKEINGSFTSIEVLADDKNQEILLEILDSDKELTASQIADRCKIPLSTVYRKIKSLQETSLITESTELRINGKNTKKYSIAFDEVKITLNKNGYDVRVSKR